MHSNREQNSNDNQTDPSADSNHANADVPNELANTSTDSGVKADSGADSSCVEADECDKLANYSADSGFDNADLSTSSGSTNCSLSVQSEPGIKSTKSGLISLSCVMKCITISPHR